MAAEEGLARNASSMNRVVVKGGYPCTFLGSLTDAAARRTSCFLGNILWLDAVVEAKGSASAVVNKG